LRILTDENISPAIVAELRAAGHDVLAVAVEMPAAPDEAVIDRAVAEGRVLVTEDKDFGELAFKHDRRPTSVIRLALAGYQPPQKAKRLRDVLEEEGKKINGRMVVVERARIRSRVFPKP
jgi:predicted nuclease of predicted toxin-antitoxin system